MDKARTIQMIEGKIGTGRAAIGISYIIGTDCWKKEMSTYATPATITIESPNNLHVFEIPDPRQIVTRYQDKKTVGEDSLNIILLSVANMLTQIFEIMKNYSKETKQYEIFQKLPWFNFMRHIRNAFGHNYIFIGILAKDKPNYIQLSNKKIELNETMNGQELDLDVLPIPYCYEIAEIMLSSFKEEFN